MTRPFFRVNDAVLVSNLIRSEGRVLQGRVICVNRKCLYDECVVVLIDEGRKESYETFRQDGKRHAGRATIKLGRLKDAES